MLCSPQGWPVAGMWRRTLVRRSHVSQRPSHADASRPSLSTGQSGNRKSSGQRESASKAGQGPLSQPHATKRGVAPNVMANRRLALMVHSMGSERCSCACTQAEGRARGGPVTVGQTALACIKGLGPGGPNSYYCDKGRGARVAGGRGGIAPALRDAKGPARRCWLRDGWVGGRSAERKTKKGRVDVACIRLSLFGAGSDVHVGTRRLAGGTASFHGRPIRACFQVRSSLSPRASERRGREGRETGLS
ncbi:hypothetical protein LY76DRAFT_224754 [Colletotrichum caudatum]|nr:hypothetical protein LY76DRAFT_224754 [Colletotrichum caudatum]